MLASALPIEEHERARIVQLVHLCVRIKQNISFRHSEAGRGTLLTLLKSGTFVMSTAANLKVSESGNHEHILERTYLDI